MTLEPLTTASRSNIKEQKTKTHKTDAGVHVVKHRKSHAFLCWFAAIAAFHTRTPEMKGVTCIAQIFVVSQDKSSIWF